MIRRVTTAGLLIPLVIIAIRYLPFYLFLVLLNIIILLSLVELFKLLAIHNVKGHRLTFVLAILLSWIWILSPVWLINFLILTTLICIGNSVLQFGKDKGGFISASANLLAIVYISVPVSIAGSLHKNGRWEELLLILSVIWAGDIVAYLVGRKWGQHKVIKKISPHKSLEGYLAGLLGSVLVAIVFGYYFLPTWSMLYLLLSGLVLAAAGMLGDLFESTIKRSANFKDSSNLLPGHGGVLDRLDSLFVALPAYHFLLIW